ncbi:hypothetical protein ACET3X_002549 [Alternaria dauci]|uniref:Heterokaryon incompatibility domain-containing protein n=1 Tax=Alternaria dauci TaxID=48095 RepID=A0ABR3UQF5_9PLEO
MRLLQYSGSGELSIHSFDDGDVPRYAILSHTWGADRDEVTFADLETGHGKVKPAYEKILFCLPTAPTIKPFSSILYFIRDALPITRSAYNECASQKGRVQQCIPAELSSSSTMRSRHSYQPLC